MPKGKDRTLLTITVTPAQRAAVDALRGSDDMAVYVRRLLAEDATSRGVVWPDDLNPSGVRLRKGRGRCE